jgi:hypothetical protein
MLGHTTVPNATVTLLQDDPFVTLQGNSNDEFVAIETTTSDASGSFKFTWPPAFEGGPPAIFRAVITAPYLICSNEYEFPNPLPIALPPYPYLGLLPTNPPAVQIYLDPASGQNVDNLGVYSGIANSNIGTIDGRTTVPDATVTLLQVVPSPAWTVVVETTTSDASGSFQFTGVNFPHGGGTFIAIVEGPTLASTASYTISAPI